VLPIRDLIISLGAFGSVPFILKDPYIGVLAWNLFAFLNPHQYTWAFARDFRFSLVIAITTLVSFLLYKGPKRIPWSGPIVLMVLLSCWMSITTLLALNPTGAFQEWQRFSKIILLILVALALIDSRQKLDGLIWVICVSLGFFGFKGGLFTLAHGGIYSVGGPPGSFIEGNNEIAFALIMCLPLMRYLQLNATKLYVKIGLSTVMLLSAVSIVGSYSRGALIAGAAMVCVLGLRSHRRLGLLVVLILLIPAMLSFMPEKWHERMDSIQNYEQDASAMGRINAWMCAWNLANDRPIFGGGARTFTRAVFYRYAPNPEAIHDVHSIYFEMLAEQGFVGLFIFLSIGIITLWHAQRIRKMTKDNASLRWAFDLASMCQVTIIGYAVGGAFLGLAYWDLPYTVVAIVTLTSVIVEGELSGGKVDKDLAGDGVSVPV
jgi:probable O-glycosylation ligase (exosortase A-associated)